MNLPKPNPLGLLHKKKSPPGTFMVRLAKSSETSNDRMQEPHALAWLKVWMMMMMMMMMTESKIWLVVSTQPIWKICSSKWESFPHTDENKTCLKSLSNYCYYYYHYYYCYSCYSDDIVFLRKSQQALIQGRRNPVVGCAAESLVW